MALKDKWKATGKNIGHTFKDFGKAMATTAKVAVGKEERVDEDGNPRLKGSWSKVGHDFGDTGKSIGVSAKGTVDKVVGNEEKEEKEVSKPKEEDVIDVESKEKDDVQ